MTSQEITLAAHLYIRLRRFTLGRQKQLKLSIHQWREHVQAHRNLVLPVPTVPHHQPPLCASVFCLSCGRVHENNFNLPEPLIDCCRYCSTEQYTFGRHNSSHDVMSYYALPLEVQGKICNIILDLGDSPQYTKPN